MIAPSQAFQSRGIVHFPGLHTICVRIHSQLVEYSMLRGKRLWTIRQFLHHLLNPHFFDAGEERGGFETEKGSCALSSKANLMGQ